MVEMDGFSVEDLLDLEEFCEADKDGAEEHEQAPVVATPEEKPKDDSHHDISMSGRSETLLTFIIVEIRKEVDRI
ncbi:hypothetical protein E2562_003662 [Oryza meyeriana var. granulata]|uniref:Uncharacterized protein n=1 Tax=Oryza meyeriana var. granulata TaxID=110450 RepID=A0A6G1C2U1_9ORYZ|nr:hypothetical protein E2562_003662 [Oryza meyeriana var. granulata]